MSDCLNKEKSDESLIDIAEAMSSFGRVKPNGSSDHVCEIDFRAAANDLVVSRVLNFQGALSANGIDSAITDLSSNEEGGVKAVFSFANEGQVLAISELLKEGTLVSQGRRYMAQKVSFPKSKGLAVRCF